MKEDIKTRQQEKSYHKLFQQIADHCVANGIDMKMVLDKLMSHRVEVDAAMVKSVWRSILTTKTGKTSTVDQTREDVKNIQPEFAKFWEELTGEKFDWPAIENQMLDRYDDNGNLL